VLHFALYSATLEISQSSGLVIDNFLLSTVRFWKYSDFRLLVQFFVLFLVNVLFKVRKFGDFEFIYNVDTRLQHYLNVSSSSLRSP
jgi:hypothetical protein